MIQHCNESKSVQCSGLFLLGGMLGTTDLTVPNGAGTSPVGKRGIMSLLKNSIVVLISQLFRSSFLF